jgi:GT2 family glycosyltransferase
VAFAVKVGLVIVTFNAESHIVRCLEAVSRQTRPPDRIIIADSGSSDHTVALIDVARSRLQVDAELLRLDGNVGFAVANNRAVDRLGDCELVALLNPDAFPEPQWLASLVLAADAHPEDGSFASRLMVADSNHLLDGAGDVFHASGLVWRHGHRQPLDQVIDALIERPVFAACAAAALYRRDDWQRTGGFDERYFCYAEDVDLGFRMQLIGRTCRYVPEAVVHHVGSATTGAGSAFSVYHGYRNLEWTYIKNMPSRLFWRYIPLHMAAIVAQFVWFSNKGLGGSILRAKWDAIGGLAWAISARRKVQATRTVDNVTVRQLLDRSPLQSRFKARMARA